MSNGEGLRMGPAEVMALIRASAQKGFTGAAPLVPQDGSFRRARLEEVRRLGPADGVLLDPEDALAGEMLGAEAAEVAPAPAVEDPGRRLAEARAEGYSSGRADGFDEGLAQGRAEGRAEAQAAAEADLGATIGPARDAFVAVAARLVAGPDLADGIAGVIADAVRQLAAERAGQMIDALPEAFAVRVEAMADRVAQGVRAVSVRLNPDDLAAITPHLAGFEVVGAAALVPDARLARGDVEVRAEGIRLADLLEAGK